MAAEAAGLSWLLADFESGHVYSAARIPYWNAAVRTSVFLLLSAVLTELRRRIAIERALAVTDEPSGLFHRRGFLAALERELDRARRSGEPLGVAILDLYAVKDVGRNATAVRTWPARAVS